MATKLHTAFSLGVMIAEEIHGVSHAKSQVFVDKMFNLLKEVASGNRTLIGGPQDMMLDLPAPPPELANRPELKAIMDQLAAEMPNLVRTAIHEQRLVAGEVFKESGHPH